MPKASWGFTGKDVESVESNGSAYEGPALTAGVYVFKIRGAWFQISKAGNPMIKLQLVVAEETGSDKEKFNGAVVYDYVSGSQAALWKVKQFVAAIGVTADEFAEKTVLADDDSVLSIGSFKFNDKARLKAVLKLERSTHSGQLEAKVGSFMAKPTTVVKSDEPDPEPDEDDEVEVPKKRAAKKAAAPKRTAEEIFEEKVAEMDRDEMIEFIGENGLDFVVRSSDTDEVIRQAILDEREHASPLG